jgi:hypothetical protein
MIFATMRGMLIPARKPLAAVILALLAAAPIAARADDGMVDVRTLPRLEGAIDDAAHTESDHLRYGVPTVVAITSQATRKLLAANGWVQYVRPMEEPGGSLLFKKGQQGLYVSFTQGLGRPDQSAVSYTANRLSERALPGRCDQRPVRRAPALSELLYRGTRGSEPRFLPHRPCRIGLAALVGRGCRGRLAACRIRRQDRQRRARLFQLRQPRRRLSATADHAVAATPRRRPDQRRDQGRTFRAAADSRGRQGIGRTASAGSHPEFRKHRRFGVRPPHGAGPQRRRHSRSARVLPPRTHRAELDRAGRRRRQRAGRSDGKLCQRRTDRHAEAQPQIRPDGFHSGDR